MFLQPHIAVYIFVCVCCCRLCAFQLFHVVLLSLAPSDCCRRLHASAVQDLPFLFLSIPQPPKKITSRVGNWESLGNKKKGPPNENRMGIGFGRVFLLTMSGIKKARASKILGSET